MCKFCEEHKTKLLPLDYANTDFNLMMDEENAMIISYDDSDYAVYYPKYCPEYGRKLERWEIIIC